MYTYIYVCENHPARGDRNRGEQIVMQGCEAKCDQQPQENTVTHVMAALDNTKGTCTTPSTY